MMNEIKKVDMNIRQYQNRIGRAYNRGRVDALVSIGYTPAQIAETLEIPEASVRSNMKATEDYYKWHGRYPWHEKEDPRGGSK